MIIFFASDDFRWLLRPVSRPEVSLNCTQSGTVEKMTNCGKNQFLQSLRYYTVSLHTYPFFRMVFILSAILCWSDFTENWVESFLKKHSILHLSAFINSKVTFEKWNIKFGNFNFLTAKLKKNTYTIRVQNFTLLIVSLFSESDMIQAFGTFQKMNNVLILAYYF